MSQASRRTKALLLAAVVAAMAIAASLAISSSHREAPNIMLDPAADNTDVYAWTAPGAEDAITIASDWIPGQVPANGPNAVTPVAPALAAGRQIKVNATTTTPHRLRAPSLIRPM